MTKYNNNVTDKHAALRPIARLLIPGGGRFPHILDIFQRLKIGDLEFPVAV